MSVFEAMGAASHEQVLFCSDPDLGLKAIIAVHSTALGPALGGCRIYPYASEADALRDVMRLSRAMTYKAAVAGLDLGGGKSVIIGDASVKSEALLRAFGRHVHSLGGRYLVAEDMNTSCRDMEWIARETPHVTGLSPAHGGLGEPGPVTAFGVYSGIRAALQHRFGSPDLRGRVVSVQGLGNVGFNLLRHLHEDGARILVTDVDPARIAIAVDRYGAEGVAPDAWLSTPCDVLAPCAIGGVLSATTIPLLRCEVVAGGANNVLADESADAERLRDRGVDLVPDFVINAGGLIAMFAEFTHGTLERAMADTARIFDTTLAVFSRARRDGVTTMQAAVSLAEERIAAVSRLRSHFSPSSHLHDGRPVR
ncbi:MAG TPA: Glu/Leu/Phe/Val dehydrogenase dimerization domain-containing protein [Myxococcota bacterium]|nr:Glu/Leu/Phe/Val dehydrogenase dimerization domain-containing protein [Myxococcota bacterium]